MPKKYRVIDGSYALADKSGEMKRIDGMDLIKDTFILLAKDCVLPTARDNFTLYPSKINNVILRNCKTDQIVFTQLRFIRLLRKYCPTCGQEIQLESDDERM